MNFTIRNQLWSTQHPEHRFCATINFSQLKPQFGMLLLPCTVFKLLLMRQQQIYECNIYYGFIATSFLAKRDHNHHNQKAIKRHREWKSEAKDKKVESKLKIFELMPDEEPKMKERSSETWCLDLQNHFAYCFDFFVLFTFRVRDSHKYSQVEPSVIHEPLVVVANAMKSLNGLQ